MIKILIHVCCAPCLIYPLERLKEQGFEVTGVFYNPNIHPFVEYKNRKRAVEEFSKTSGVRIEYPEYDPKEFFQAVNLKESFPFRCSICWSGRLSKTAKVAKEKGFECFSTTLLVSPYQDQGALKKIGEDVAKDAAINFYYEDFRSGFKDSHDKAKALGMYCQKYCGCIYSEIERHDKSKIQILPNPK
ncbi:MAG: epoxyqueuosine reductase QueH [Candidatus Omnitrophota bacterium]